MSYKQMSELDLSQKRVLIREDFNVPIKNGVIQNEARLIAALDTIQSAIAQNACVMLASHLKRPKEGEFDPAFSLKPVADWLTEKLAQPVLLINDYLEKGVKVAPGQVVLLENVRFNVGEKANDPALAQKLAALCDVFVMDAFGTAHRAQASTYGVAQYAKEVAAGPLLAREIEQLERAISKAKRPLLAIVGGAKVSTKLALLESLLDKVDTLIVGGGIANTFLAATGQPIGQSLYEPDLLETARHILEKAKEKGVKLPLPSDVGVGKRFAEDEKCEIATLAEIKADDMIFDIGPKTSEAYAKLIQEANTIIWNGPVGVFEFKSFADGTLAIANAIAHSDAFSIAGGGDTLAAIDLFKVGEQVSYVTTGGGAFLEYIEGKTLPAIAILQSRYQGE